MTTDPAIPVRGWRALWAFARRDGFLHVTRDPWSLAFIPRELSDLVAEDPITALAAMDSLREDEIEERRSQFRVVGDPYVFNPPPAPPGDVAGPTQIPIDRRPRRTRPRPPRPPAA